jgi:hypothetical protein
MQQQLRLSAPYRGHLYLTGKKRSDNVDRAGIKAFNTVKEDLDEEEECKENEDEFINKRRRDYTLKDNIELLEDE